MTVNLNNYFNVVNEPNFSTVKLIGFIDADIIENIKPVIDQKLSSSCTKLIIDLEDTEFLDSHGIGFFVSLLRLCTQKKGRLYLY